MSELQLRAILAAIIIGGASPDDEAEITARLAVEIADRVLVESARKMVTIQAENEKRREAEARQATGVRP